MLASANTYEKTVNFNRREEYQLGHRVANHKAARWFVKYAANRKSESFLQTVAQREEFAEKRFCSHAVVIRGVKQGNALVYPFFDAPNLEQQIGQKIASSDDFAVNSVLKYRDFICNLPRTDSIPTQFLEFLGASSEFSVSCLTFAPYDCIPRNLLWKSDGWKVMDNEWTFSFPLPVKFLLWRGIHSLIMDLQGVIQTNVDKQKPVLLYSGYGYDRFYMPLTWFDLFQWSQSELDQFTTWETQFSQKILKPEAVKKWRLRLFKQRKVFIQLPRRNNLLIRYEELMKHVVRKIQK